MPNTLCCFSYVGMMETHRVCTFIAYLVFVKINDAIGINNRDKLINKLFIDSAYLKDVPSTDSTTTVDVVLSMTSIENVDAKEQTVTIQLSQLYMWTDHRLVWNETDFGGLSYLGVSKDRLWLPDITLINGKYGFIYEDDGLKQLLSVTSSGTVTWYMTTVEPTTCDLDVTYYPFDTQSCFVSFSTVNGRSVVDIVYVPNGQIISETKPRGAWSMTAPWMEFVNYEWDNFTMLRYHVKLHRERSYYLVSVVLPAVFLSAVIPVPFYLPVGCGEKMGVSVTTLTAMAVYLSVVSDDVPRSSKKTPLFAIYLNIVLAMSVLSVLLSAVVLGIHEHPPHSKVGPVMSALVHRLLKRSRSRCINHSKSNAVFENECRIVDDKHTSHVEVMTSSVSEQVDDDVTWCKVAQSVDRMLFVSFYVVFAVLTGLIFGFLIIV